MLLDSNGPERGAVKRSSTLLAVNPRCEEAGKKLIATIRLIKRLCARTLSLSLATAAPVIGRDLSISSALIAWLCNIVSLSTAVFRARALSTCAWKLRIGERLHLARPVVFALTVTQLGK